MSVNVADLEVFEETPPPALLDTHWDPHLPLSYDIARIHPDAFYRQL
jgi:hypothetical protein